MVHQDRKSTRLNSSHVRSSYAVFCVNNTHAAPVPAPASSRVSGMCADDMDTVRPPLVLHDFEPRVTVGLEPVDAVTVTTLMDNVTDVFMPDHVPASRPAPTEIYTLSLHDALPILMVH